MTRLAILLLLTVAGCQPSGYSKIPTSDLPDFLRPLPGATNVLATRQDDSSTWVHYSLEEPYPANEALRSISMGLERAGWRPLPNDFLNPTIPSSHVRGWTDFDDSTISPPARVHQWLAQWRNARGDIVWYALRYHSPSRLQSPPLVSPDNSHLQVAGALIPAALAATAPTAVATAAPRGR
jgi:hypothetical protein